MIRFYNGPWDPVSNPDGLVNLGTAENSLMLDDIATFINGQQIQFTGEAFDYSEAWGSLRLRKAVSGFINTHFKPHTPTQAENITISNGCSALFNALGNVLADPGDGVLLTKPCYIAFGSDFGLLGGMTPVFIPSKDIDQFTPDILPQYEAALKSAKDRGIKVKVLVLCNPHNPLGRCYPPSTLTDILSFCNTHKIHLVTDEVYAMSVYSEDGTPFTSVLSLDWQKYIDPTYFHHVYGMSKDFASGGLRIGSLWTLNTELHRAVSALANFHHSGTVNALLACRILEDTSFTTSYMAKSRQRVAEAGLLARALLDEAEIPHAPANAGFFLWINLAPWLREEDGDDGWARERRLMERLIGERVFIAGGQMQNAEEPGWFRFVFTRKENLVREGVKRLKNVCGIA
ncbi:aminotransferase [Karstenula rhodostoma CBS 690.94]|uniref:Aminotransferase n=1 Tax=Karstenula rhodostoma CBS 690.94 TaxID=1392251 RepID=A0A9P4PUH6_9PLEO|nr:aminotransferase [Karstenula rhodostoma CBS 690.94]